MCGFGRTVERRMTKKYCYAKELAKRIVSMAVDRSAWEEVEKVDVDSSRDGHELFKISKQKAEEKQDVAGINCLKDENCAVKVGNLEETYGKIRILKK